MHRVDEDRRDQGAVLVLVLVLVLILGVVAAALAGYAATALRNSKVTDQRTEAAAAVDGGLRIAVEWLKQGCTGEAPGPTINDMDVAIQFARPVEVEVEDADCLGRYLITTSTSGIATTGSADVTVTSCDVDALPRCTVSIDAWAVG